MRIAYFGLPLAALALLREGIQIELAVLAPLPSVGRRRLHRLATFPCIDTLGMLPSTVDDQVDHAMRTLDTDLLVSWFWTRKIPRHWIRASRLGAIGCHPSLLPRHRGPDPYFWAIDSGDDRTGVSVHFLDTDYDTGPVLAQSCITVGDRDSWQLARALDRPSLSLLVSVVRQISSGWAPEGAPQAHEEATWAPFPSGDEMRVEWHWSTIRTLRRIRALAPTPGLLVEVEGIAFRVVKASATSGHRALRPGEAFIGQTLAIQTADGAVSIDQAWVEEPEGERLHSGQELAALVSSRRSMVSSRCPGER